MDSLKKITHTGRTVKSSPVLGLSGGKKYPLPTPDIRDENTVKSGASSGSFFKIYALSKYTKNPHLPQGPSQSVNQWKFLEVVQN